MRHIKKLNSAHALAATALFVALSGSAYAVGKTTITSKQVKNESLTGVDVRNDSLTGGDINESSLNLPAGPAGPQGPVGPSGQANGPAGGALTGTYPNPGLAANSVGGSQVASESIGSSEIENGNLNGVDVGQAAGTVQGFDAPSIAAGGCVEVEIDTGATVSTNDDAFAVTMGTGWPAVLSVTPEPSPTVGKLRLNICNHQTIAVNEGPVDVNWVAFDV